MVVDYCKVHGAAVNPCFSSLSRSRRDDSNGFQASAMAGAFFFPANVGSGRPATGVHTVERPHRRARFFSTVTLSINLKREKASIKSS